MGKWILKSVVFVFLFLLLGACHHREALKPYTLKVEVAPSLGVDSVELAMLAHDYGKWLVASRAALKDGNFESSGQLNGHCIARLRFSNNKEFYFILEPCLTEISFGRSATVVWGGQLNHVFAQKAKHYAKIQHDIDANFKKYCQLVADTAMTYKKEPFFFKRDSVLKDSLNSFAIHTIEGDDVVSQLFAHYIANQASLIKVGSFARK